MAKSKSYTQENQGNTLYQNKYGSITEVLEQTTNHVLVPCPYQGQVYLSKNEFFKNYIPLKK